jgi:hypothetical protein
LSGSLNWTFAISDATPIVSFQWGIGTGMTNESLGDVVALQSANVNHLSGTIVQTGLQLQHNISYFLVFIVEDALGYISTTFSPGILVDVTNPTAGFINFGLIPRGKC